MLDEISSSGCFAIFLAPWGKTRLHTATNYHRDGWSIHLWKRKVRRVRFKMDWQKIILYIHTPTKIYINIYIYILVCSGQLLLQQWGGWCNLWNSKDSECGCFVPKCLGFLGVGGWSQNRRINSPSGVSEARSKYVWAIHPYCSFQVPYRHFHYLLVKEKNQLYMLKPKL